MLAWMVEAPSAPPLSHLTCMVSCHSGTWPAVYWTPGLVSAYTRYVRLWERMYARNYMLHASMHEVARVHTYTLA